MKQICSVSQLNRYIKNIFAGEYALHNIYVKGEVSNCKYHTSGHIYFTLKDRTSQISCVMFAGQRKGLGFRMTDGQCVVAYGNVSIYERDGKYQLYASQITADGEGALYEQFEKLKRKLYDEGLFDEAHKKPIPPYARKIGIVTADTGAAIQDICNIAARRNPYVQLYLYPARVQGENAQDTIIKGIRYFDSTDVDIVIIGRGGGSIEDLWAFNEESLARAIYAAEKPIISAVGHETDTTISDFAADLRAPTPSASAELAVCPAEVVENALEEYRMDLLQAMQGRIDACRQKTERYQMTLQHISPRANLASYRQYVADMCGHIEDLMEKCLTEKKHQLRIYIEQLKGLSPLEKLAGGYAYVTGEDGTNIKSIKQVKRKDVVRVALSDGTIQAEVTGTEKSDGEKKG